VATRSRKEAAGPKGRIVVEQYRSPICCQEIQKRTLRSLGLRRIRQRVELPDNPAVRGMVAAIPHLVRVVEEDGRGR
jgi:large subunit ribosomal protein L30